jgi:hypothetical protein
LPIAFDCLRANGVKLNPENCIFGVPHDMLLGYIVSQRGIEPNPGRSQPSTEWACSRPKGGAKGVVLLGRLEPFHLAAQRKGSAPLPTPEEARALLLDYRGPGCARQAEGDARSRANPHAASRQRASVPLHSGNHPGGQRGYHGGTSGGRAYPTSAKAGILHQQSVVRDQGAVFIFRSCSTRWCSRGASCGTTSRPIRSW